MEISFLLIISLYFLIFNKINDVVVVVAVSFYVNMFIVVNFVFPNYYYYSFGLILFYFGYLIICILLNKKNYFLTFFVLVCICNFIANST
jgi:hypothetical protein